MKEGVEFSGGGGEMNSEIIEGCGRVIEKYFSEDAEYYLGFEDEEDLVGALYGALLEIGEDPDEVLIRFGVLESGGGDE